MQTARTTLNLPDVLIRKAKKAIGVRTKTQAIVIALTEAIQSRQMTDLVHDLAGTGGLFLTHAKLKKLRKRH